MIEEYKKLKPHIINFTFDERLIYTDFDKKEVKEILLNSSSFVRKEFTMHRIKNIISKNNLDLEVYEDEGSINTTHFFIKSNG